MRVLVGRPDGKRIVLEVAEGGAFQAMATKVGVLCTALDAVVLRAELAPGCTVELLRGAFGAHWPDRLRSCAQCADQVAAWHGLQPDAVWQLLLKLDGWAWNPTGLRVPTWLGAESVAPAEVQAAVPGLWERLEAL